mgnify:CR=1 FL=1
MKDTEIITLIHELSDKLGEKIDAGFERLRDDLKECHERNCAPLKESFVKHEAGHSYNGLKIMIATLTGALTTVATLVAVAKYWH